MYSEHQLVWVYFHGYMPKQIDHINRIRNDNRIENLREVTASQNQMNNRKRKIWCNGNQTSSINKGVSWYSSRKKWRAVIMKDRKQEYIGTYNTEEEAARAYDYKAIELFGEYANLNFPRGDYS